MTPLPDKSKKLVAEVKEERFRGECSISFSDRAEDEWSKAKDAHRKMRVRMDSGRRELMPKASGSVESMRWIVYSGMGIAAVIIAAMAVFTKLNESNPKINPLGITPLVIDLEEAYPLGEQIADILSRKDEAIALYQRFLHAETIGEQLNLVRNVSGIESLVKAPYRVEGVPPGWQVPPDVKWDVHTDQDPVFGVLSGYFPDDKKFHAFMTLEGGKLHLDWKATVQYSSMVFSRLVEGEGDASEMRVWVEPATFYSAAFPESEYRCYKIYSLLEDDIIWAFARRGTVEEQALVPIFHKSMFGGDESKPVMLVLALIRGPASAAPNQWLIKDLLHKAWVLP